MYCKHCGREIDNDSEFCKECGGKQSNFDYEPKNNDEKQESLGFWLGFLSLVTWILPIIGYPVSIMGIVISSKNMNSGKKYATAGLIMSVLGITATLINSISGAVMFS